VDYVDGGPADRYLAGKHQAVAGSPKKFPYIHGDGVDLNGSWV